MRPFALRPSKLLRSIAPSACAVLGLLAGTLPPAPAHAQITVGSDGGDSIDSNTYSGTSTLTKIGTNFVSLTGNNTYGGGTLITSGMLGIGANSTTGSLGTGPIVNNATLVLNRINDFTLSQSVSGTGQVKKWGYGTTTITGSNSFTGDFIHNYGVTVLNRTGGPALFSNGATGNVVIQNQWGGDPPVFNSNNSWYGAVVMGATNQLGSNVNVIFQPANIPIAYSFLVLDGKDTTIGNLSSTAPYASSWGIIENSEGGYAGLAAGRLTVTQSTSGTFTGEFRDGNWNGGGNIGLTKNGSATLALVSAGGQGIGYTGSTIVNAGRLVVSSTSFNSPAAVAAGATFEVSATVDQTLKAAVVVSGSGVFAKSGNAKLTLNSANTHSGGTEVNGGSLQFTSDTQLGAAGAPITLNGGALYNGDSNSTVNAARTVTLGTSGGYLLAGWGKSTTVAGRITGQGGLGIAFDNGVAVLSGSNDYAGATTVGTTASPLYWIDNGANITLRLGNANALPTGNALAFGTSASNNTATLDLNGYSASVGGMTAGSNAIIDNTAGGSATLTMAPAGGVATFGGVIKNSSGTVSVVKSGAGTQVLSGDNTYGGITTITSGTLQVGNAGNTGSLGAGAVVNNGSLVFNRGNSITVANAISGSGGVTQRGVDALTLTGSNTFTGSYTHAGGVTVLNRTGGPALFASGSGGELVITNSYGGNTYWYGAVETATANQLGANVNVTFSPQNISGGYSYLVLKGNDTVIGNLQSTSNFGQAWGIVENQESGSFGNSRLTVTQTVDSTFTGEFRNGFGTSVGTIGLTKNGSATLTLADGGNQGISYTGSTIVNAGRLVVKDTRSFASSVTVNANAQFAIQSGTAQTWTTALSGSGTFIKQGVGTLTLAAQSTHTGGTVVESGTLLLGASDRLADSGAVTVNAGGFDLGGSSDTVGAVTLVGGVITNGTLSGASYDVRSGSVSAVLAGNGSLVKSTAGTVALTAANTYTGQTTVQAGELKLNGSLASALVSVAAGATLSGTGSIAGDATIAGLHAPGNSPGIQTVGGNLTYAGGAAVTWELAANTLALADRGIDFDGINVGGNLTFSGATALSLAFNNSGSLVNWNDPFWSTDKLGANGWLIYDVAGTTTGLSNLSIAGTSWLDAAGISLADIRPYASFGLEQVGSDVYLTFQAVPEPSTLVLLGIGGALAIAMRRRRLHEKSSD